MDMERPDIYNLLTVGVGGQGVISASNIIAWAALKDNYKVRTAETNGMAQRGGSVSSYLRFGEKVEGPLIPKGSVSGILSFELIEALRNVSFANPETRFIVSTNKQISPTVLISKKIKVDVEKCTGCESCVSECPSEAISMADAKAVVNADDCIDCGVCVDACPLEALEME